MGKTNLTKGDHSEKKNVIPLVNRFSHISVRDLEEIMEWQNDHGYLSEKGKVFRHRFWELFIKSKS
jgi:hypothetical protein